MTIQLQATLYRTHLPGRQPLVILNHGSTDGERRNVPSVARLESAARWFLSHGYNVIVPMRKGRGFSTGPMLEPSDNTIPMDVQIDSAVEDLNTIVDAMRTEPWVDPHRIIVSGVSRGGFLAAIYASQFPEKVEGVINFSGGWWADWTPGAHMNSELLADSGKRGKVPELWLYADHDSYYTLAYDRTNFDAFRAAGGTGQFHAFHGISGNGHALFDYTGMWGPVVETYLRRVDGSGQGHEDMASRQGTMRRQEEHSWH